jgi:hypothetical protein
MASALDKPRVIKVAFTKAIVDKLYHDGGILPLDVLMQTMRQAWREKDYDRACAIATQAAPYIHPKLAQLEFGMDEAMVQRVARVPEVAASADAWKQQYAPKEPEILPPVNGNWKNGR